LRASGIAVKVSVSYSYVSGGRKCLCVFIEVPEKLGASEISNFLK